MSMKTPGLGLKICRALAELPKTLRRTRHPRLIMTLLVKNEAQMLAHNLEFHHRMGWTDLSSPTITPPMIHRKS